MSSLSLQKGWNLIGVCGDRSVPLDVKVDLPLWEWHPGEGYLPVEEHLYEWRGYWLKMDADGTVNFE